MKAIKTMILATIIGLSIAYVFAWSGPPGVPPDPNADAPINVGALSQYKTGALGIGGLFETDTETHLGTLASGRVGIRTTNISEGLTLDVEGPIGAQTYCDNNGSNCKRINELSNDRGALVYLNTTQSIPGGIETIINWNTEDYDTDNIHDNIVNNSRLTVPDGTSKVRVGATSYWAVNGSGIRKIFIEKNGSIYFGRPYDARPSNAGATNNENAVVWSSVLNVVPGDYFEVKVYQTSGSPLNFGNINGEAWFAMEIIQ